MYLYFNKRKTNKNNKEGFISYVGEAMMILRGRGGGHDFLAADFWGCFGKFSESFTLYVT